MTTQTIGSTNSTARVLVWNEYVHERNHEEARRVYPRGMHQVLREALEEQLQAGVQVRCATLDEPEHGLADSVLDQTDVLVWWGHVGHEQVADAIVDRVHSRVLSGMGLVVLHSGHGSKIFRRLMGTSCMLQWREAAERERLWVVAPGHPIVEGLPDDCIELPAAEMYGEFFDIPTPEELIFISWFQGGEVFRSGCTFRRGAGKIFYFRPGHETYPIYYDPQVRRVVANAVTWARPRPSRYQAEARHAPQAREPLPPPPPT